MTDVSNSVLSVIYVALDHATTMVVPSGGQPGSFAIVEDRAGKRGLYRAVTDRIEDGPAAAREIVASKRAEIERAAIVWDGYLTVEGVRTEAIFVEGAELDGSESVIFAQRYGRKGFLRKRSFTIGNPALVGHGDPFPVSGAEL